MFRHLFKEKECTVRKKKRCKDRLTKQEKMQREETEEGGKKRGTLT